MTTNTTYRMNPDTINKDLCQARRRMSEAIPGYTPKVYQERQCTKTKKEGDLCTNCNRAFERATLLGDEYRCHKPGHGEWAGFITEDPHPTCHMLGTTWAENNVRMTLPVGYTIQNQPESDTYVERRGVESILSDIPPKTVTSVDSVDSVETVDSVEETIVTDSVNSVETVDSVEETIVTDTEEKTDVWTEPALSYLFFLGLIIVGQHVISRHPEFEQVRYRMRDSEFLLSIEAYFEPSMGAFRDWLEEFSLDRFLMDRFNMDMFSLDRFIPNGFSLDRFVPNGFSLDRFVPNGFSLDRFVPNGFSLDRFVPNGFSLDRFNMDWIRM